MGEARNRKLAAEDSAKSQGLAILNVAAGDTKITFDKNNPEERERACKVVQDMLKRGYAILVHAGEKDGKPLFLRATEFDPETAEYIVAGVPETEFVPEPEAKIPKKVRLPAEGRKAVAVARSAGGMSTAANSVEMENLRRSDGFAHLRGRLAELATMESEWAGMPMPLDGHDLVVEPHYPRADKLMSFGKSEKKPAAPDNFKVRSRFYSNHLRSDIFILEVDGKIEHGVQGAVHSLAQQMTTLGASLVWGVEQEHAALQLLASLVSHHAFKQYLLTGSFLESSRRSGLTYIFRKLRPTVAISMRGDEGRIIAALCMHPIAYYAGSWAGAMCPTDDVVAHLMLMRGDEAMFWRRCNQHQAHRPEAGL